MKLYTVLKMMNKECIVMYVINYALNDIIKNHLISQTHTNKIHFKQFNLIKNDSSL